MFQSISQASGRPCTRWKQASTRVEQLWGKTSFKFEEHLEGQLQAPASRQEANTSHTPFSFHKHGATRAHGLPGPGRRLPHCLSGLHLRCLLRQSNRHRHAPFQGRHSQSACETIGPLCRYAHFSTGIRTSLSNTSLQEMAFAPTKPSNISPTLHPLLRTTPSPWNLAHWHLSSGLEF